jgi:glyoxylase-like metal-dependent hydrolase (beta-lactamase superfamily II)
VNLKVETFVVGPLPNNLYLVIDDTARQVIVVDPSIDSEPARQRVRDLLRDGYTLNAIWNTHGHFDHIYDNAAWREEFAAPLWMHPDDQLFIDRLPEQALWMGFPAPPVAQPDHAFTAGQTLHIGEHELRVLHTPGHSPGSVSFHFADQGICISGDVLFRGSVGRTDLPGCSFLVLQESLLKLSKLPAATRVLPGHGDATTIGFEMSTNPFYEPLLNSSTTTQETD